MSDTESEFEQKPKKGKSKNDKNEKGKGKAKKEPKKKKEGKKEEDKQAGGKKSRSKPKKAEKVLDEGQSTQLVLDYMTKQNRPYSLINIFDNLHAAVKKPLLEKILDDLCEESKLKVKDFNKNKIYMLDQGQFKVSTAEMEELTKKMAQLRDQEKELEEDVKGLQAELKGLSIKPRLNDLRSEVTATETEIGRLQRKMDVYGGDWIGMPQKQVEAVEKLYEKIGKERKRRERIVREGLKSWADILEKKLADTAEELGIDLLPN